MTKQAAGTTKYTVHKANILDENGNKRLHGDVAELGPELARRYNKLGFLKPYIEDDIEDGDDDETSRA